MQSFTLNPVVPGVVYPLQTSGYMAPGLNRFRAENNSVYVANIAPAQYLTPQEVITNKIASIGPLTNSNIDNKDANTSARFYSVCFTTAVNTPTPSANAVLTFTWVVYNPEDRIDDYPGAGLSSLVNPSTIDDAGFPTLTPGAPGAFMGQWSVPGQGIDLNGWDGAYISVWVNELDTQAYFFLNIEFSPDTAFANTRTLQLRYYARKIYIQLPKLLRYVRALVFNGTGSTNGVAVYGYARRTQSDIPLKMIASGLSPYSTTITIASSTAVVFYVPVMQGLTRVVFYSASNMRIALREVFSESGLFTQDIVILTAGVPVDYLMDVSAANEMQCVTDSAVGVRTVSVIAIQLDNTQV